MKKNLIKYTLGLPVLVISTIVLVYVLIMALVFDAIRFLVFAAIYGKAPEYKITEIQTLKNLWKPIT
ncbi:hypothetical protein LCGC14_0305540 [marine sediment metagenome]|uniref:Uncharacterized protein n=1 Tax=marine sediment metagenome TaxID=412755 RepID=A0A0F9TNN9_9ZZZZ